MLHCLKKKGKNYSCSLWRAYYCCTSAVNKFPACFIQVVARPRCSPVKPIQQIPTGGKLSDNEESIEGVFYSPLSLCCAYVFAWVKFVCFFTCLRVHVVDLICWHLKTLSSNAGKSKRECFHSFNTTTSLMSCRTNFMPSSVDCWVDLRRSSPCRDSVGGWCLYWHGADLALHAEGSPYRCCQVHLA